MMFRHMLQCCTCTSCCPGCADEASVPLHYLSPIVGSGGWRLRGFCHGGATHQPGESRSPRPAGLWFSVTSEDVYPWIGGDQFYFAPARHQISKILKHREKEVISNTCRWWVGFEMLQRMYVAIFMLLKHLTKQQPHHQGKKARARCSPTLQQCKTDGIAA